jgi:hypothetical protein
MNAILLKALILSVPACMLVAGSAVLSLRSRGLCSLLQLLGAVCLMVVVIAHVSEALHLFSWMGWGIENSIGHYLDLGGAVLGLLLFPTGYLLHAVTTGTQSATTRTGK